MGCGSDLLPMIFIITLLMLLSSQRTHIPGFNFSGLHEMHFMEENKQEYENYIKKISELDENEEKQSFIVEKFRSLVGLKSFHTKVPPVNGDSEFPSLSPNIEADSPAPSPVLHVHPHSHHPRHHSHWNPPLHKTHPEDKGKAKRILVVVLVSVGIATLIGACVLILVCRKFTNHKKKPKKTMPLCSKDKETRGTNQSSSNKVSLNSGLDLFYLNALGDDIEQHACSLKKTSRNGSEYDNVSNSSTKEIVSVHEDVESVKNEPESDEGNSSSRDKIIPEDFHSSDNESFHSIIDS